MARDAQHAKEQIAHLLAKKNGGTEAEVQSAIRMATKLMNEWRLTEADLAPADKSTIIEKRLKPRASPPRWELQIAGICQELFQVKAWQAKLWDNGTRKTTVCFAGYPDDVDLAVETFVTLKAQILPMCTTYSRTGVSYGERCHYGLGVVQRVMKTVIDAKAEADARCKALVVSRVAEVNAWADEHLNLRKARRQARVSSHFFAGYADGVKVKLSASDELE